MADTTPIPVANRFRHLATRELSQLANELQNLKDYAPLTSTGGGQYQGHILAFVKGLRISAKLTYFLRKCISTELLQVSWGHIIDVESGVCSPECDVIIHSPGHYDKWNEGEQPIMEFLFVEAKHVKAVVSCKSTLASIDTEYPAQLRAIGVNSVILFAECCSKTNFENLKQQAIVAGYTGLWCSYFTLSSGNEVEVDEEHHLQFHSAIREQFQAP
ncbi:MAG: hypothetical protein NTV46_01370 [Verrucomicrobia bacterium]|nr:hypothetical protein [Verrucomicrobiota bacterium]